MEPSQSPFAARLRHGPPQPRSVGEAKKYSIYRYIHSSDFRLESFDAGGTDGWNDHLALDCFYFDQSCGRRWRNLRLLRINEWRKCYIKDLDHFDRQLWGYSEMSYRNKVIAAALLSLSTLAPAGFASAADLPYKVKAKPVPDIPFFLVIDDRVSYSWMPKGTDPGVFSPNAAGGLNSTTAKSVYSFTHFDVWAYGTNFFTISMLKSDHNDPANPCTNAGVVFNPGTGTTSLANCAGATEVYGLFRSTIGFNEAFGTHAFTMGPLHNVSLYFGMDANTENQYLAPAKRDVVGGLQFAFDLPYKGYFNVQPIVYYEFANQNAFTQCGGGFAGPIPYPALGANCLVDGNRTFKPTWGVEINYYMDLNFLPQSMQYFAISGRAGFYGTKGYENNPLVGTPTAIEINSEPIRLTFDMSKAIWGPKYAQFLTTWVAYRYWQNKFGIDHTTSSICNIAPGISNNTCTESTVYAGVTAKF
jgi:hypothetical protein